MNDILKDWATLNKNVMKLSVAELQKIYDIESKGKQRLTLLLRIQGRLNKLLARQSKLNVLKNFKGE
jgi:hypothetical protein